jgi:glycosyltransferase involved in cell wall biosynthesis
LHITAPAQVGGLESVVRMLARGHRAMGHRVCVAAVTPPGEEPRLFLEGLRADGVEVASVAVPGRAYLRERAAMRRLCEALRPSVVHTHGYRSDVIDAGVARAVGVPVITTVHGFTGGGVRDRMYERAQEYAFRHFDAVVAVSRSVADRLRARQVPERVLRVIPNAFEDGAARPDRACARRLLGIGADDIVLGWVGRMSREKGADVLIEALALVPDRSVRVSMIGDGPDRAMLEARARSLGIAERITWHGIVPEARRVFAAFDAFVLSSRTEGTPIVLFEAMAAGVPIVATAVGGVPDVVGVDEALLVPADDPRALAEGIGAVQRDAAAAARRVAAARIRLEQDFGVQPWLERYEQIYRELDNTSSGTRQ